MPSCSENPEMSNKDIQTGWLTMYVPRAQECAMPLVRSNHEAVFAIDYTCQPEIDKSPIKYAKHS